MSDASTNLLLPYLAAGQAQKHVTVNESLTRLDALVQLAAESATTSAEPGSPSDGQAYILPSGKTGTNWGAMADGAVAYYVDGAWLSLTPREGWLAFVKDVNRLLFHDGAAWQALTAADVALKSAQNTFTDEQVIAPAAANAAVTMSAPSGYIAILQFNASPGYGRIFTAYSDWSPRWQFVLGTDAPESGGDAGSDFAIYRFNDAGVYQDSPFGVRRSDGLATFGDAIAFTGALTPAQITADQNDYAPTGLANASVLRVSTDASRTLTGLAGGEAGRVLYLVNVGSNDLVLAKEDAGSIAANRFALSANVTIAAGDGVSLLYDATASRWRRVG